MAPLSGAMPADMRAVAGKTPDSSGRRAAGAKSPFYNALLAHDLRGDDAAGGARGERAAADRAGDRQLPAAADRQCGRGPETLVRVRGRSADRRGANRHADAQPALAAGARAAVARSKPPRKAVWGAHRPSRSFRTWKPARRMDCSCATPGIPVYGVTGISLRSRRRARARQGRTDPREVVQRRAGVRLSARARAREPATRRRSERSVP